MNKKNHIQWINGLRGIACLGVAIHHFLITFFPATHLGDYYFPTRLNHIDGFLSTSALGVLINGNFYVCIFCCLSGYVLSHSVIKLEQKDRLAEIITKRYFRLALPMFIIAFIISAMMHLNLFSNRNFSYYSGGYLIDTYFTTFIRWRDIPFLSLVSVWFHGDTTISPVFWMLNILFMGSFFSIILSVASWKLDKKFVLPLYLLLIIPYMTDYNLCFVFGTLFAYINLNFNDVLNFKMHGLVGTLCILFGLFLGGYPTELYPINYYEYIHDLLEPAFDPHISLVCHTVGAGFLILGIMLCNSAQKVLSSKVFVMLGTISYAVYLVHMPIICSFSTSFFKWLFANNQNYASVAGITFLLTIAIVLACATAFYFIIEKTCEKLIGKGIKFLYPAK
ncbi:MAG: acyltransferase [Lachnospiraceae bacterium]|nr:acyltransferase [Lachnospiraceae bacterium]